MFRTFLAFLIFTTVHPTQVNVEVLLAFLECLHFNSTSPAQMLNYLSALKCFAVRFDLYHHVFDHSKVHMYVKALQKTTPARIKLHNIVDINFLKEIVKKCDCTYLGKIFKAMYLLAFFWFLEAVKYGSSLS